LTLKLLQKRLGVISEAVIQRLSAFAPEPLEQLSLASLDFAAMSDLDDWLEKHAPDESRAH
jgi:hypothetical protein